MICIHQFVKPVSYYTNSQLSKYRCVFVHNFSVIWTFFDTVVFSIHAKSHNAVRVQYLGNQIPPKRNVVALKISNGLLDPTMTMFHQDSVFSQYEQPSKVCHYDFWYRNNACAEHEICPM